MAIRHTEAKLALCEKWGLDPKRVEKITIFLTPNDAVRATVELFPNVEVTDWITNDMPTDSEIITVETGD